MPKSKVPQQPPSAPRVVPGLIERFTSQIEVYRSGRYNEAQLRQEFLNPLFKALGWDMDNEQGFADAYKDVIHEDAIRIGSAVKAPDYCFRVGGTRKFFLEAKKPSVDIKNEPTAAYQLRRYAWSAKLPLSILSDFEQFAVYDCRVKPEKNDSAATARIFLCTFRDYPEKWDWLVSVFSKDAIQKGSFDKFAESSKGKRGTSEVDTAFLAEIEGWRTDLARNIALRNPRLTQRELNFAVQRIIDRIIFLRICEDRGIEDYGRLHALTNGAGIYPRLCQTFEAADARYNSGLFHFRKEKDRHEAPDELTLTLEIDDKLLRDILGGLYYPDSPYEFSVLSADILGQVYEQFLGKVIRLTAGHRAVVDDKPEVKKAGGVYYTPTYIVDYIVRQTVGKLVEGKTPKQVEKLRILDPACGSGSFLIGAYQFLLDWHRDWYAQNEPEKHAKGGAPALRQTGIGGWALTIDARKRILLNNIFGVDIDAQAVEVTKLSLLLKVLEGETGESLQTIFQFLRERALPDIGDNIKCGNSLVGPEFYEQQQMALLDEEERYRINVFDWEREFPDAFKVSRFDAVIGNPPYVRIQTSSRPDLAYYSLHYRAAVGNYDIYCLFIERGVSLLGPSGRLGMILPHRFYKTDYGEGLRGFITSNHLLAETVDFDGYMVFQNASINTCLLFLDKHERKESFFAQARFSRLPPSAAAAALSLLRETRDSSEHFASGPIRLAGLSSNPWVFIWPREESLWNKLQRMPTTLGDASTHIFQGLKTGSDSIYIGHRLSHQGSYDIMRFGDEEVEVEIETSILRPLIKGGEMRRYAVGDSARWILFPYDKGVLHPQDRMKREYPRAWAYLLRHKSTLENRENGNMRGPGWYAYTRNQALTAMYSPKIITPDYYAHASYCLDEQGSVFFCGGGAGGYGIVLQDGYNQKYLLGLLNSQLLDWFIKKTSLRAYQTAYMYVKKYIAPLPIRTIDFSNPADALLHDRLKGLVEQMIVMTSRIGAVLTPQEQTALSRQIASTDAQIDRLVYELYGLTDDEITVVEEATT